MLREDQQRSSEVALRQLHADLVKMAISDSELREVWPEIGPGIDETRKDHYCNLILNLQKVAYETKTIELAELRGALAHLMTSSDMRVFWQKARDARIAVTGSDAAEDFFTQEVDQAFLGVRSALSAVNRSTERDDGMVRKTLRRVVMWLARWLDQRVG